MKTTQRICAWLVVLFFTVGLGGFLYAPLIDLFKALVPYHLLLMLVLMIISQPGKKEHFWLFFLLIYMAGFMIELIGTRTGLVFGRYHYGSTLGIKLVGTPLMIGVNWILVIYSAGMLLSALRIRNFYLFLLIGASLVTLLDYLIEPVAIQFDYWSWDSAVIPMQNYVVWFVFSALLLGLFYKMDFRKQNVAAATLFIMQFVFFLVLRVLG
ncbi:carotenoid biosynthesis protein [Arcticibacter eurypsychrophilus]|uniref:carotenoid biosynthesis protein n=1 Tax=Arcticibacter eurypsychrophilus TaxID=1434752 RepID=UPI001FE081AE|nr:carotenoid biosynthesis protein [Arcticibacter eurypsychrophilus]